MLRRAHLLASLAIAACSANEPPAETCASGAQEAMTVCAGSTTVSGVDVSTYDGAVDWTKAKAAGIDFAFARISDGVANPDDQFAANWKGMKAAGVLRGAYQYWRASADPTAQANLVLSSLASAGGLVGGDLPVVMDIETSDGEDATTITKNMTTWLAAVHAGTGRVPIVYTSSGTYPITATTFDTYPLWVANYGATCPDMPVGWSQWLFWQTGDTGSIGGIGAQADTDVFNGTLAQLQAFADANKVDAGHAGAGDDAGAAMDSGLPVDGGALSPEGGASAGVDAGASMGGAGSNPGPTGSSSPPSPCGH